jgi:hypothetical protein
MLILPLVFSAGISASEPSFYPQEVRKALDGAGGNRAELEKVIRYYAFSGDSLKLQAAFFLIANMKDHCYVTYALDDTLGNEIDFNVLDYPDFETLLAAFDTLESSYGELDFKKKDMIYDLEAITASFLIENIDLAFRAWREKPWDKGLSFEDFCRYVLPYRGSNEPLESWRGTFRDKYKTIESTMVDPGDPVEAARIINDDIKTWFGFDPRYYFHPTDLGLSEMMSTHLGRCEDMTNITIYAMRANGLAVTSDYTPYWANTGNNHAWNAIVVPSGKAIPFMGAESNPGEYHLSNKLAKAYRKTYDRQTDCLAARERKQEKIPAWLSGEHYVDVTPVYADVCDITVPLESEPSDSIDVAYLCVFNSGEWKAIDWGLIADSEAAFTDVAKGVAYLAALYMNEEIVPFSPPFVIGDDCRLRFFTADEGSKTAVHLTSTTAVKQETSTDGIEKTSLEKGREYELMYWQNGWLSLGKAVAGDDPLIFEEIPKGALFWLTATDSDREERIFTIENGKQVWW